MAPCAPHALICLGEMHFFSTGYVFGLPFCVIHPFFGAIRKIVPIRLDFLHNFAYLLPLSWAGVNPDVFKSGGISSPADWLKAPILSLRLTF